MDLNIDSLVTVLTVAAGKERGANQKASENQLKQWETVSGYHFLLQSVYLNVEYPLQIRWLAVICLKNGVEKYWRSTRVNAISKEEKFEIKRHFFNLLDESNDQLAIQNAHALARVCRFDFPAEWPTLFEEIAGLLESNSRNIVKLHNLLLMTNQILKTLASIRIGRARAAMQNKVTVVVPHLVQLYKGFFNHWTSDGSFNTAVMEVGYLCLKNLRRAIVDGYEYPHRDAVVVEFFQLSLQHFQKLLLLHESSQLPLLERYLKAYVKLYTNLVNDNVVAFVMMPDSYQIFMTMLSLLESKASEIYNSEENEFWEQLAIKMVSNLKKLTAFGYKKGAVMLKQRNDQSEVRGAAEMVATQFFNLQLVEHLVDLLITWYMKLRASDLESWSIEPEEWVNEQLQVSWEYQIRPCAENYFQDLVSYFKPQLSGFILRKIESVLSDDSADILTKDSVLAVFQLSANAISESCNFDQLFRNFFLPEALKDVPLENKLVKRRICLIASEWIPIQGSKETRLEMYQLIIQFLKESPINDRVVKLTAVQTLQHLIDDWEFRKYQFQPFLTETVAGLLGLLKGLEFTESKIFVLKVLSVLIERTNPLVSEQELLQIMTMIPAMWDESNNANEMIVKNSLMRVLRDLTIALNSNSNKTYPIVLPLIELCCTPGSDLYALLCEDGLELWGAVLKHLPTTVAVPDQIINLFPLTVSALSNWTEILPTVLQLVRSYAMLDFKLYETEKGLEILKILGGYLTSMRDDSIYLTSSLIETLVLQNQDSAQVVENITESGLFAEMVQYLTRESQTPNCEIKMSLPLLRLVHKNPVQFLGLLTRVTDTNLATKLNSLIESLINLLKLVYDSKIRKLFVLALFSFYDPAIFKEYLPKDQNSDLDYQIQNMSPESAVSLVLSTNFSNILFLATHLLEEVNENEQGDCEAYHKPSSYEDDDLTLIEQDQDETNEYALEYKLPPSAEKLRYNELIFKLDPVHRINTKGLIKYKMDSLSGIKGYQGLLASVDGETLEQLQMMINK
ncbi:hypothetical protein OGAPHI_005577 [Ogataea philodendri]|uniref:Importin N-terminal domain-containing protein n=1 Tax=Ogataea philodendri TaxID=1378263 RepID=A0A9P8T1A4_9ASCO|nr:uncharacterized protein OGAPHI_005577 [Ogataea philodendri]KAH3662326.1 hypothetical protein OGAPHI_005577 [Ogataea philodendri]